VNPQDFGKTQKKFEEELSKSVPQPAPPALVDVQEKSKKEQLFTQWRKYDQPSHDFLEKDTRAQGLTTIIALLNSLMKTTPPSINNFIVQHIICLGFA
jgi:hypothetical protein